LKAARALKDRQTQTRGYIQQLKRDAQESLKLAQGVGKVREAAGKALDLRATAPKAAAAKPWAKLPLPSRPPNLLLPKPRPEPLLPSQPPNLLLPKPRPALPSAAAGRKPAAAKAPAKAAAAKPAAKTAAAKPRPKLPPLPAAKPAAAKPRPKRRRQACC
jgi:pyruvate/2-oxoglutarate dehydrogenase complex dihydrolipoamide acyltransferase (E2) component